MILHSTSGLVPGGEIALINHIQRAVSPHTAYNYIRQEPFIPVMCPIVWIIDVYHAAFHSLAFSGHDVSGRDTSHAWMTG